MECKLAVPNLREAITAHGARPAERADGTGPVEM